MTLPIDTPAGAEMARPSGAPASTPQDLLRALERPSHRRAPRLGQTLLEMGCITEPDLASALAAQRVADPLRVGEQLLLQGRISAEQLDEALNRKLGFVVVDAARFPVEQEALQRIPPGLAERLNALPLMVQEDRLLVAVADPKQQGPIDELAWASQCWVQPVIAQAETIRQRLRLLKSPDHETPQAPGSALGHRSASADSVQTHRPGLDSPAPTGPGSRVGPRGDDGEARRWLAELEKQWTLESPQEADTLGAESEHALVKLLNRVIADAHEIGATDIHVECEATGTGVVIRLRRDGRLSPHLTLPSALRSALVARIKIMAGLDVSERRRPQDGRINFSRHVPGHALELRVATIPTRQGMEDVVLRLLPRVEPLPLERIGLNPRALCGLITAVERPHGLILCAGPTGSGKTTTLHSLLAHLNTPDRKIWTAEDPIEITQEGLRQVQVQPRIDWTFDKALRAFLRADPDVIMVGEIRDRETARTAVEAALTGHLVLSTIHTNSAAETVVRLLDMGIDPLNFADSLLAVVGQRLVRRLCTACRTSTVASPGQVNEWLAHHPRASGASLPSDAAAVHSNWVERYGSKGHLLHHACPGCDTCEGSGLRGRIGLHEVLCVTPEIRSLMHRRAPASQIQDCAVSQGMVTLRQDGIEKVLQGLIAWDEARSVFGT